MLWTNSVPLYCQYVKKVLAKVCFKNIGELFHNTLSGNNIRDKITCIPINKTVVDLYFSSPICLNAVVAILVLCGNGKIQINYKTHTIESDNIVLLSASHLFKLAECSDDFKCLGLFVSKDFMDEMDATDMIYKRVKYGARLYNDPIICLDKTDIAIIQNRLLSIDGAIDNAEHYYYKEIILNSLFAFYLDLSNIIEHSSELESNKDLTRYESTIKSFIELLIDNYRTEHQVGFYASQLHITPHYLTLIVKRITGQTVSDFIFEMLFSEARNLLTHSKLSIQEITTLLSFSDQASFGKFFKRRAGISPKEFRKG